MSRKTPVVIMIQGEQPGAHYVLHRDRVTAIGRSSKNTISLVSPSVSGVHCRIRCVGGVWHIADSESKAGTYLNGRRIATEETLKPGDVIRISNNVLRFDLIDVSGIQDAGVLALREAQSGVKLVSKKGFKSSLKDIRLRSRLANVAEGSPDGFAAPSLPLNIAFVGVWALGVAAVVGGLLGYRHMKAQSQLAGMEERLGAAREGYARAVTLLEADPPRLVEALQLLDRVQREYPGTEEAFRADSLSERVQWRHAEVQLAGTTQLEKVRRFGEALRAYERLLAVVSVPRLTEVVTQRRDFCLKQAVAAFRDIEERAQQLIEESGDAEMVAQLYREAVERFDVPELTQEAEDKIEDILASPESSNDAAREANGEE